MHIGLIGGIGPAATDFYYRGLIDRHVASGIPLELTIAHADVREMSAQPQRKEPGQAGRDLRRPDRADEEGRRRSRGRHLDGRPFLHQRAVADLAAADDSRHPCRRRGDQAAGSGRSASGHAHRHGERLYGGVSSAELIAPEGEVRPGRRQPIPQWRRIGQGQRPAAQIFFEAGRRLSRERGAEAIMLGGTDLFLAFAGRRRPSRWSIAPTSMSRRSTPSGQKRETTEFGLTRA